MSLDRRKPDGWNSPAASGTGQDSHGEFEEELSVPEGERKGPLTMKSLFSDLVELRGGRLRVLLGVLTSLAGGLVSGHTHTGAK